MFSKLPALKVYPFPLTEMLGCILYDMTAWFWNFMTAKSNILMSQCEITMETDELAINLKQNESKFIQKNKKKKQLKWCITEFQETLRRERKARQKKILYKPYVSAQRHLHTFQELVFSSFVMSSDCLQNTITAFWKQSEDNWNWILKKIILTLWLYRVIMPKINYGNVHCHDS